MLIVAAINKLQQPHNSCQWQDALHMSEAVYCQLLWAYTPRMRIRSFYMEKMVSSFTLIWWNWTFPFSFKGLRKFLVFSDRTIQDLPVFTTYTTIHLAVYLFINKLILQSEVNFSKIFCKTFLKLIIAKSFPVHAFKINLIALKKKKIY